MVTKQDRTAALVRKLGRLLQEIPKKATVERVHHLRTTVRRLETIHAAMPQQPVADSAPAKDSKDWKRLSKVRKRAGKVRDFDVQMVALGSLRLESGVRDKARLMNSLEDGRARQTKKLVKAIEEVPRKNLAKAMQRSLVAAPAAAGRQRQQQAQWVSEALDHFGKAYQSHQPLKEDNLHDFRMECKRARYRAEMAAPDRRAQSVVKHLKKVQDSIGDWHDWLTLTQAAEKLLQNGNPSALITALRAQTHARFLHALQTAEEVRGAISEIRTSSRRKPPASVEQAKSAVA